ncbi:helix-turn-helix domain-containing protein [Neolewinella antarctica]|uniref:AraC-like DNA-binding protein n=1 Tax=Neolewinella antarctica TaxID=442734 RepID=A0ABX0XDH8_9BACT|nr:helix-turn-helix domain-containing protein [Neolewinella antarctica]NJC26968.1 AraC-like DNA-binding protein [Neolewinella antarctica]
MRILIKHMVSLRCKLTVAAELKKLRLPYISIELGSVALLDEPTPEQRERLKIALLNSGLELMDDPKVILIEKIKSVIIKMIHYDKDLPKVNYSDYISEKLGYDYNYLSNMFSEVRGNTIQQFIIQHKIERAKELLTYDEHSLTQISYLLHYSSVAHLSNQFKKVTGLCPSQFKKVENKQLRNLEDL